MRDVLVGGTGLVIGGTLGATAILGIEFLLGAAVAATVFFMSPAVDAPTVVARPATAAPSAPRHAEAGQLQLFTMAAVVPLVDGNMITTFDGTSYVADLAEGTHRLQLLDMLGRESASVEFSVVAGQRTQMRWAKKMMEDLGRVPMSGATAAPVAAARVVVPVVPEAQIEAHLDRMEHDIARAEAEIERAEADIERQAAKVEGTVKLVGAAANLLTGGKSGDIKLPKFGKRLGR